jgi:hypothetical protein
MDKTHLIVEAQVRYWEDAEVNGQDDVDGTRIPLRQDALWCPIIELATGKILNWPQGITASIHYKVCDEGEYWLGDSEGNKDAKWKGHYVPDAFLCVGEEGHGDYIILSVSADGLIAGWQPPTIKESEWEPAPMDADYAWECIAALVTKMQDPRIDDPGTLLEALTQIRDLAERGIAGKKAAYAEVYGQVVFEAPPPTADRGRE